MGRYVKGPRKLDETHLTLPACVLGSFACAWVCMVHLKPMAQKSCQRPKACDSTVVVTGVVTDLGERWIPSSMVVNRRTNAGEFVGSDGEFIVRACWATPW